MMTIETLPTNEVVCADHGRSLSSERPSLGGKEMTGLIFFEIIDPKPKEPVPEFPPLPHASTTISPVCDKRGDTVGPTKSKMEISKLIGSPVL
jgi:hypothetical protein